MLEKVWARHVVADGIYSPQDFNDRLLLGLKGTMSEFELGLLKQRADAARTQMIQRGAVLWDVPVGYVRSEDHEIEMIADRQVQEAIRGVFAKFGEVGSARQVTIWYREEQIPLPHLRITVSDHLGNPFGIQWQRYWDDAPYPELVKTIPHVAFEVDDLSAALAGHRVIIEPNSPSAGVTVAFIEVNGAPVELMEIDHGSAPRLRT